MKKIIIGFFIFYFLFGISSLGFVMLSINGGPLGKYSINPKVMYSILGFISILITYLIVRKTK